MEYQFVGFRSTHGSSHVACCFISIYKFENINIIYIGLFCDFRHMDIGCVCKVEMRPIMFCKIVSSIFRRSKCNRHSRILKFLYNAFCNRSSLSRLATGSIANAQPHQNYKYKCLFHFVLVLIGNVFSKVMK